MSHTNCFQWGFFLVRDSLALRSLSPFVIQVCNSMRVSKRWQFSFWMNYGLLNHETQPIFPRESDNSPHSVVGPLKSHSAYKHIWDNKFVLLYSSQQSPLCWDACICGIRKHVALDCITQHLMRALLRKEGLKVLAEKRVRKKMT